MKNKKGFIAIICCIVLAIGIFFAYQYYQKQANEKLIKQEQQQISWIEESKQDYEIQEFDQKHKFDKNFKKVDNLIQEDYKLIYEYRKEINQELTAFMENQFQNPEMIQKDSPKFEEMHATILSLKNKIKASVNALSEKGTEERIKKAGLSEKYENIYYDITEIHIMRHDFDLFNIEPTNTLTYCDELLTYLSDHPNDWTLENDKITMTSETAYQYTTDLFNRYH